MLIIAQEMLLKPFWIFSHPAVSSAAGLAVCVQRTNHLGRDILWGSDPCCSHHVWAAALCTSDIIITAYCHLVSTADSVLQIHCTLGLQYITVGTAVGHVFVLLL